MRQLVGNLKFLVIFSILFLISETSGLKCWRCSSDATNSKFCGDTLDLSQLTEQQKRWNYVECDTTPPKSVENIENLIPKCRILLQLVNEVPTYTRSCYLEQNDSPPNSCEVQKFNPSYVKTVSCKTCVEDGCNDKLQNSAVLKALSHTVFAVLILFVIVGY